jgi:hypothetical protein
VEPVSGAGVICELRWLPRAQRDTERQIPKRASGKNKAVEIDLDSGGNDGPLMCGPSVPFECLSVVRSSDEVDPSEVDRALRILKAACDEDRVCGCAVYGEALVEQGRDHEGARGVALLLQSCRSGAREACGYVKGHREGCVRTQSDDNPEACAELAKRRLVVTRAIELPEALGCWGVASGDYDRVCIEKSGVLVRNRAGEWDRFALEGWRQDARNELSGTTFDSRHSRGQIMVEAFEGTQGRGLRFKRHPTANAPWLYLVPLSAGESSRTETAVAALPSWRAWCQEMSRCLGSARRVSNDHAFRNHDRFFDVSCFNWREDVTRRLRELGKAIPKECE